MNKGDRVEVKHRNGGAVSVEGNATLHRRAPGGRGMWLVEFDGEPGTLYPRLIMGADLIGLSMGDTHGEETNTRR